MEFFANVGYGMILLAVCAVVFTLLYLFQKQHPLLNKVLGYCLICLGILVVLLWGKGTSPVFDDPGTKVGIIISILGAALLALGDTAKGG